MLITPKHSLTNQVNDHYLPRLLAHLPQNITAEHEADARNKLLNVDGFGVAWYTYAASDFDSASSKLAHYDKVDTAHPAVYKTTCPPTSDANFRSICANTETRCCFAHIRATSATAVVTVNNHPFVFGRISFMHNGAVSDFVSIRRAICQELDNDVYANVLGSTDSEHVAALYVTYLTDRRGKVSWEEEYTVEQMHAALTRAIDFVIKTQQHILGDAAKPNSLNLAVTDGTKMVAYRFRNHVTEQPPSLYYSTKAGVTLNRKYPDHPDGAMRNARGDRKPEQDHGSHVIVASEPSTYKDQDWLLMGKNQALLVDQHGEAELRAITYNDAWNAQDVL